MDKWKCTVCGEIVNDVKAPDKCPVCGVGPEYFVNVYDIDDNIEFDNDEKFVIIGASGAGMCAAEEIRKRNKKASIIILSKENIKGYYRPQLSKILSHNMKLESLIIKSDEWFEKNGVDLYLDTEVLKVDTGNKKIIVRGNDEIVYTKLIIASGAEVFVPPIEGRDKKGVYTLRYIKDVLEIKEFSKNKKNAAVIGGGVLGLEIASELNNLGLNVTVIEKENRILPKQLDSYASAILEEIVKNSGVRFRKNAVTKEIIGHEYSEGVLLEDGEIIPADLVVISTGVKANSSIVPNEVEVKRAIVVNNRMETSVSDVYACGDCAEFEGINYALWSEAILQGRAAGINASGDKYLYEHIIPSTTLNAFNSRVFSIGYIGSGGNSEDDFYEVNDEKDGKYVKLYFKNEIMAGGILIGDTSKTAVLVEGLEKKSPKNLIIEQFH